MPDGQATATTAYKKILSPEDTIYQKAFLVSPDAVTITEMGTGRYLDINKAFEDLFGLSREEVIGRQSSEFGIWADPSERAQLVEEIRLRGFVRDFLAVGRHKDGSLRTCSLNGLAVTGKEDSKLVLVVRDITEQVRTERALREAVEKFSKAFHATPDAVLLSELNTGKVLEVNEGFIRLSGYSREEIVGRRTTDLGLFADPADRNRIMEALRNTGSAHELEIPIITKDGGSRNILFSGEILELNSTPHIITVARDITHQKLAEQEKAVLEAQLRRAQKLEALGTLAGGIAHDFNNILTAIMAYTDFAKLDISEEAKALRHLEEVKKASVRAQDLVRRILAFSRQQKQERRPVDIQAIIREAVALLRPAIPSSIHIEEHYLPDAQIVLADPGQMHQVIMNLGTNAAHAMRTGAGRLTIRLDESRGPALARDGRERSHICITVQDTGHGMPPSILKRMFEPFFTTKPPGEGTGLGLSVVHGIIHDHDGFIDVESNEQQGTCFRIQLPLHMHLAQPEEALPAELPQGNGERILFIDDEPAICDFALQLLTRLGYRVTTCRNPVEALAFFTGGKEEFDLVVTDLTMPLLTGVDVATRLLARHPGLPIILMSGFSGSWTAEKVRDLGIRELVTKPLSLNGLACAVKRGISSASRAATP